MMLTRTISIAAFAAVAGTLLMPSSAEAGHRWRFLQPPHFFYEPQPRDFYTDQYGDYYDLDDDYYEPRYYEGEEPVYIAPKKKKKKTAKAASSTKPVTKKSVASTKKKGVKTQSVASVEKKAVTEKKTASAAGMSCDKAEKIVSGYGFTSVKPASCTGQVFAFNATRSGKAYVIKLSSSSGELTEVRKVQ
jgi:hypothetical protein